VPRLSLQTGATARGRITLDDCSGRLAIKAFVDAVTAAKQPLRSIAGLSDRRQKLQAQHQALLAQVKVAVASLGWATEPPGDRAALDRGVARLESALSEAQGAERDRLNARDVLDGLVRDESEAAMRPSSTPMILLQEAIELLRRYGHARDANALERKLSELREGVDPRS
jgi:hypothetical protein